MIKVLVPFAKYNLGGGVHGIGEIITLNEQAEKSLVVGGFAEFFIEEEVKEKEDVQELPVLKAKELKEARANKQLNPIFETKAE